MTSSAIPESTEQTTGRKLLFWLPTLLWLCLLAVFSTDTFSAEHTRGVLWKIIHAVYGGISEQQFEVLHVLVRKSAHFTFYGLLSVFAFYSWKTALPRPRVWSFRWSGLAVGLTFLAGSLDEFHQRFVPSRGASFRDVLLDTAGALFFQSVLALFIFRRRNGTELGAGSPAPASMTPAP
ncbi:MAG TPA: VanZ family protein [Candidatus Angelobacter sp.]|nr:VanZ family protein [Candidatus Angelobacter sp.]